MQETTEVLSQVFKQSCGAEEAPSRSGIRLELEIVDPECAAALVSYPAGRQRDDFARQALRIGILALRQAHGIIDADKVRDEGERLMSELTAAFLRFEELTEGKLAATLREYFDPTDGRFTERVGRLVKSGGELEQVMREQIAQAQRTVSDTLVSHVGEHSPLLRLLSPTEDNELLACMRERVEQAVQTRSDIILREFSLDNPDGALSRLVRTLGEKHGKFTEGLAERIDDVIEEFSLDSEGSALSRLVRQVEQTQKNLSAEFSLDAKDSALARLRREMLDVLEKQNGANRTFREEVLRTLNTMKVRKEEAARSTVHGREFELQGYDVVEKMCLMAGDLAEFVGNTTGSVGRSKVGDSVITIGADSSASGARIVLEFKEDKTYTIKDSLEETDVARKNRLADIGIFVHSKRTAPANLPPIQRIGQDILVVWDAEDEKTDIVLQSALSIARALSVRAREAAMLPVNPGEMEAAIHQIERQVRRLQDIRTKSNTIRSGADNIIEIATKMEAEITRRLSVLDTNVGHLKSLGI